MSLFYIEVHHGHFDVREFWLMRNRQKVTILRTITWQEDHNDESAYGAMMEDCERIAQAINDDLT